MNLSKKKNSAAIMVAVFLYLGTGIVIAAM